MPFIVLLQFVYEVTPPPRIPRNSGHPPLVAGPVAPLPRCHLPKVARLYGEAWLANASGRASSDACRVLLVVGLPMPVRNGCLPVMILPRVTEHVGCAYALVNLTPLLMSVWRFGMGA